MEVKNIWTEKDFDSMSWHDNYIHCIYFPGEECELKLDIDYIFSWELNESDNLYQYWISPCWLTFLNVSKLRLNLDFDLSVGLEIVNITKTEPRLSPNKKLTIWTYVIETDKGMITFQSTGFEQRVNNPPIFSDYQILPR
jgi:hypothetical protein